MRGKRSRTVFFSGAALALLGVGMTAPVALADDLEVVWVGKAPTVRFKPDLKDVKREKNECFCLVVLLGKKDSLVLDEVKVSPVGDEYVGWNPNNRSAFYFSKVKEKGGLFEGYQWVVYDDERRLIAQGRAVDVPLVAPSGKVSFRTTRSSSSVEIQTEAKGEKFEPPAGAKLDWAALGKEAKVFVTVATFPTKAGKPPARDPKDPVEATQAFKRSTWEPFTLSLVSATESTVFDTARPAEDKKADPAGDPAPADKQEAEAKEKLILAKLVLTSKPDTARQRLEALVKAYPKTQAAEEARKLLAKIGK